MAVSCMRNASGHNYRNSSFIMDVTMRQIPRSTEHISSFLKFRLTEIGRNSQPLMRLRPRLDQKRISVHLESRKRVWWLQMSFSLIGKQRFQIPWIPGATSRRGKRRENGRKERDRMDGRKTH